MEFYTKYVDLSINLFELQKKKRRHWKCSGKLRKTVKIKFYGISGSEKNRATIFFRFLLYQFLQMERELRLNIVYVRNSKEERRKSWQNIFINLDKPNHKYNKKNTPPFFRKNQQSNQNSSLGLTGVPQTASSSWSWF